jgi:hypothetical protein
MVSFPPVENVLFGSTVFCTMFSVPRWLDVRSFPFLSMAQVFTLTEAKIITFHGKIAYFILPKVMKE